MTWMVWPRRHAPSDGYRANCPTDILDEFSATKLDNQDGPSMPNGPGRPEEDEDFAKQLQAGMKDLLGGLADTVSRIDPERVEQRLKETIARDAATAGEPGQGAE